MSTTSTNLEKRPPADRVPEAVARRGITESQWLTLTNSLYPGASPASVVMVWEYCKARGLDPLKRPCHIVPVEVKDAKTGQYTWRDVVMPGIYEYRTTAHRTGQYLGHSKPEYGMVVEQFGVQAPEWCELVIYRATTTGQRAEFPVVVRFAEVVATSKGKANARWTRAPQQMLTKCAEAAGLREAFPEDLGGEITAEEMEGQHHIDRGVIEAEPVEPPRPAPDKYEEWLIDLTAAADEGEEKFLAAWAGSREECRTYLTETAPEQFDQLKVRAQAVLG